VTIAIRPAAGTDLAQLSALLAAVPGAPADIPAALAAGRVLVAPSAAVGAAPVGIAVTGADGAAGSPGIFLWAAPGDRRVAVAQALAAAALGVAAADDDAGPVPLGPSLASIHVQTDDAGYVERTLRQMVPRLGRSAGSVYLPARDGWIAVFDELCDRDRKAHRRLAEELSVRLGLVVVALAVEDGAVLRLLLFDRGRMVDEYLSVPEYHGQLPPGEVLSLALNPTLVARLTGADPGALRAIARTAASPAELPPAPALAAELGSLLGLHAPAVGHAQGAALPGSIAVHE
jgi:hypothetical protein